ncbi:malonate decarboxylase holo-[acyl-carrier-protein] synthase [Martelella soudanensis]|uniref:malonate decarboxylase holo-[acyl-carrier-protein] synthase n=1 Tax=unclassified Martelella TaxID=2629616 RepID=UPI0015E04414|nr:MULTISPECIES: malonate decarboxylase holo-[acyl-carrier-protein] synthase [unclassified Martelella]
MIRRHDMIFVRRSSWQAVLAAEPGLRGDRLVAFWADRGWPLVARRGDPHSRSGVALGLPLPPSQGKHRHSFVVPPGDIAGGMPPPSLSYVCRAAPLAWWPTLLRLDAFMQRHALDMRIFGSLAWSAVTGLDYLSAQSDLDVLVYIRRTTDLDCLADGLSAIEATAPMRIDGEFVRDDGTAVNWREFRSGAPDLLAKSMSGVCLVPRGQFVGGRVVS